MNHKKQLSPVHFLPGIIWFIVVAVLMFLPGKEFPKSKFLAEIFFDKIAHIGCFGLLTLLWAIPVLRYKTPAALKWRITVGIFGAVVVWGLLTEVIQGTLIEGRSFDLLDWLADSTGAAGALLVVSLLLKKAAR